MKGFNEQVAAATAETIGLGRLVPFSRLRITNQTGAVLYVLVDAPATATPSATNAHFTIPDGAGITFEFDNTSQVPGSIRAVSAVQGYVHFIAW